MFRPTSMQSNTLVFILWIKKQLKWSFVFTANWSHTVSKNMRVNTHTNGREYLNNTKKWNMSDNNLKLN